MEPRMTDYQSARNLLHSNSSGVLSTISAHIEGYPFGSVVPYALSEKGEPVLLISSLAEHYKNVQKDPRVSLIVVPEGTGDVQTNGRITLVGKLKRLGPDHDEVEQTYYRYFPHAEDYHQTHDFSFFRLSVEGIRFIGGFGQIFWMEPNDFFIGNSLYGKSSKFIVEHMNEDHGDSLRDYCTHFAARELKSVDDVRMVGIDTEGFDVMVNKDLVRFLFESVVLTPEDARKALVDMAKRARA